ncbi:tetratricopeptide repeat protein [Ferrimonas aestuarii]|uniref:Tetratricopeptide repeat protein n=1 Tax=Ferrimonas aestuarii TaxID=2569539 RepID=A0A4U1BNV7_9GAMM|nr:tetratricopeptide repeat protein [Ferrimonas aestuarii]TKB56021.1 tetratricopeptide repeat protein [Ferrimonas aestuarii]
MKQIIFALCCLSASASIVAQEFSWDGGDLQFEFSSLPYQQREPKITQQEYEVLGKVVDLVKQQREADAIAELKLQIARSPSAAMWFSLAQMQQQQQQPNEAIAALEEAVKLMPHFTRAHESLGTLLTQKGELKQARPHLQLAASQGAPAQIYAMLGYGYLQDNQPQAAKAAYSQALMLAGDNPQWQRGLLHAAVTAGDDALARSLTEQLLVAAPNDAQLHQLRASLAQRQQDWPQTIASLEIAQQLQPHDEVKWKLAQIYLDQGYYQLAEPHLNQLVAKGINGRQSQLLEVSDYLIAQQQYKSAASLLKSLVDHQGLTPSQNSHALTSQAKLLAQQNPKRSVSTQMGLLNKALKQDPLNGTALIALARHYESSDQAQAEALYRRAAAISSVQLEALQRHAQLLLTQEAYRRAEQLLQQAVKQSPNDKQLRDNLALVTRMVQSQG